MVENGKSSVYCVEVPYRHSSHLSTNSCSSEQVHSRQLHWNFLDVDSSWNRFRSESATFLVLHFCM